MTAALSLEQVRFIAATVAPHFGPLCDDKMSLPFTETNVAFLVSRVFATSPALHATIAAEIFPDVTPSTHPAIVAIRTLQVVTATLKVHDHRELMDVVAAELANHSVALRGDF
jgi:hypothetical protein